jgi:N-sulfoglucosamine sulfohydrolase
MDKPNILYIHSHDTGRYIQPYGHAIATPCLQRLAEEGVLFRQNFCANPTCSPSRAALLTGCYPHENGMAGLAHRGWSLNDYEQHIIHALRRHGYVSALIGQQHIASPTDQKQAWEVIGYDRCLEGETCEQAASFLENPPDEPFFLTVGFFETHREFPSLADAPDDSRYCLPPEPLPDTPETRQDMARYKASARVLDHKMGQVFAALDRCGLAENTLVICTTDHGIPFPRMKCNLQDSGTGTMLIMRGPGGFSGGRVVDSMTSHLDVYPTICDLLAIQSPSWLRGESLIPLVRGEAADIHETLFSEVNYHAAYEPMRAARTKRWKYIRRFDGRSTPVLPNCDDGESKSGWIERGWRTHHLDAESLFDLAFDPGETNNLAGEPANQTVLQDMRTRLAQWMSETNDPLLHGAVPAPANAAVNDADGLSPREKPHRVD